MEENFKFFINEIKEQAKKYGWNEKIGADSCNAGWRDNTKGDADAPYFGFIHPNNPNSGAYSDLSLVMFPNNDYTKLLVAIGVGTNGFVEDYEIASMPQWRRAFLKLLPKDENYYSQCKISFADIETYPRKTFDTLKQSEETLKFKKGIFDSYGKLLPISFVVDIAQEKDKSLVFAWLAQYAMLREWNINGKGDIIQNKTTSIHNAITKGLEQIKGSVCPDEENVRNLLRTRSYVVLQGAPGVGKTHLANKIAKGYEDRVKFTQFHAETSYTDFVEGILPVTIDEAGEAEEKNVQTCGLGYERHKGVLVKAIEAALKDREHNHLLIIDEINRANLSNVLGPVFYLFEPGTGDGRQNIKIGDTYCSRLPVNLHVIATMNTADRSLAVVDYALRRRFAWYTIEPKPFEKLKSNEKFHDELFEKFDTIFQSYATDEELNLQPGPSYFKTEVASSVEDKDSVHKALMKERLEYELMPLIKEYLNEGLLSMARNEFASLFLDEIGKLLYK